MENSSVLELSSIERIVLLSLLGQIGLMLFFYWTGKIIGLYRRSPTKLSVVLIISSFIYFGISYFIYETSIQYLLQHSIFWIPIISLIFTDVIVE